MFEICCGTEKVYNPRNNTIEPYFYCYKDKIKKVLETKNGKEEMISLLKSIFGYKFFDFTLDEMKDLEEKGMFTRNKLGEIFKDVVGIRDGKVVNLPKTWEELVDLLSFIIEKIDDKTTTNQDRNGYLHSLVTIENLVAANYKDLMSLLYAEEQLLKSIDDVCQKYKAKKIIKMDNPDEFKELLNHGMMKEKIDEILGTRTNVRKKVNSYDIKCSLLGMMAGVMIPIIYNNINPNLSTENKETLIYSCVLLGAVLGFSVNHLAALKDKYGFEKMYEEYEYAYTRLSRKDQIEVLKKSKELYNLLSNDLKYKNNIKMAKEYLNINDSQRTFFENLDYEHPYHQLLTNEQEKEIHNQGLLTPEEAVRYWESGFSDVCIPSDKNRCERFKNCHDCLVHYSETKPNGWEPIHFYQKTLGPKPSSNK